MGKIKTKQKFRIWKTKNSVNAEQKPSVARRVLLHYNVIRRTLDDAKGVWFGGACLGGGSDRCESQYPCVRGSGSAILSPLSWHRYESIFGKSAYLFMRELSHTSISFFFSFFLYDFFFNVFSMISSEFFRNFDEKRFCPQSLRLIRVHIFLFFFFNNKIFYM